MKQSGTTFDWLENYSTIRGIVNEHLVRPRYERHVADEVRRAEEVEEDRLRAEAEEKVRLEKEAQEAEASQPKGEQSQQDEAGEQCDQNDGSQRPESKPRVKDSGAVSSSSEPGCGTFVEPSDSPVPEEPGTQDLQMQDESEQPEVEEGSEEVKEGPKPETLINTEEDFDKFVRQLAWN